MAQCVYKITFASIGLMLCGALVFGLFRHGGLRGEDYFYEPPSHEQALVDPQVKFNLVDGQASPELIRLQYCSAMLAEIQKKPPPKATDAVVLQKAIDDWRC